MRKRLFLTAARIVLCSVAALMLAPGLASHATPPAFHHSANRAPFAFHYEPTLTEEALAWYSHFDVLVTHDPLPRHQVDQLHAAGTKVLLYEWAVAFYESRATPWQRSLSGHYGSLLNEAPLTGGVGSQTSAAWYFDPASSQHEFERAADIASRIEETGYDGVFFDTTTVESVHPEARAEYERRHPGVPYDRAYSRFLRQLRSTMPRAIVFTNQGYRSAPDYLPHADWDLSESLIIWPDSGSQPIRPWNDFVDPWNSISVAMHRTIAPIAARYPNVRFGHLNYLAAANTEAIRMVVAAAQLFGGDGYVAAPAVRDEIDPIYFRRPGKPISARLDHPRGVAAWRFFENGLIVISSASEDIQIPNRYGKPLRDHFTQEQTGADIITIPAASGAPRAFFFDVERPSREGRR